MMMKYCRCNIFLAKIYSHEWGFVFTYLAVSLLWANIRCSPLTLTVDSWQKLLTVSESMWAEKSLLVMSSFKTYPSPLVSHDSGKRDCNDRLMTETHQDGLVVLSPVEWYFPKTEWLVPYCTTALCNVHTWHNV